MTKARRQKSDEHETPEQRVTFLMEFTKGTLPVAIIAATDEEAAELQKILERKGKKAANLTVKLKS